MARAALLVNPAASRVTPALVEVVERELAAAGDLETQFTERAGHATALAQAARARFERIYVLAGDGGFNEAVNGMDGDVPIGFIPGGGTSVLPRALGLPRDPVACARALARSEATRRISLGNVEFSGNIPPSDPQNRRRRFTFSAGLGLDAELVRAVDALGRRRGRRPGDLAFVGRLVRLVGARRGRFPPAMTVGRHGAVAFALVANTDPYSYVGPFPLRVVPDARFDLGLDLVAPRRVRGRDWPRVVFWLLARPAQARADWILHLHDVDDIRIECEAPTPLQIDGEDLGDVVQAVFTAERGALKVVLSE